MEPITSALVERGVLGILCVILIGAIVVLWRWMNRREDKKDKAHTEQVKALTDARDKREDECRAEVAGLHRGYQVQLSEKEASFLKRLEEKNDAHKAREAEWAERVKDMERSVIDTLRARDKDVKDIYEGRLRDKEAAITALRDLTEQVAIALTAGTAAQTSMHQAAQDIRATIRGLEEDLRKRG